MHIYCDLQQKHRNVLVLAVAVYFIVLFYPCGVLRVIYHVVLCSVQWTQ